jgi:adenylate cyclase
MDARASTDGFLFGQFRLDPLRGLFRCDDAGGLVPVSLGSRALDVLRVLIERHGDLVSKDEIMAFVWTNTTVEETNLTVQISALRRVLDQGSLEQSCIQTVPGRGYRFVLPVTRAEGAKPDPASASTADPAPTRETVRQSRLRRHWLAALGGFAGVLVVIVVWTGGGWFATRTPAPRLSLVVLPLQNLSGDPKEDYIADGITDDLTTELSHVPGAFVISRSSAYTYKNKTIDAKSIGEQLRVRYVLEGSVRRMGDILRVNAELSSTETGAQLWSDSFDQKASDLAEGQEQILVRMRAALNISLADIESARSLREHPAKPDAFDLILQARATELLPETKDTAAKTLALYEQALERDPTAVSALTGAVLAVLYVNYYDAMPYRVAMDRAVQYLARAQALDPNSEMVLVAQGHVLDMQGDGLDYRRAYMEGKAVARKLIDLYPNNPWGYFRLGVIARGEGRYDEAVGYFTTTIRLDPRRPTMKNLYWNLVYCNVYAGHDREGLEWADRAMGAEGDLRAFRLKYLDILRAVAYARTGNLETAKRLVKELNDRYPFETWRRHSPKDPDSETGRQQTRSLIDALRTAGMRDHVDPDADFGVVPDDVLHPDWLGWSSDAKTPMTAPGVTTVNTEQLAAMLQDRKPLMIDTMALTWYRSVPGAVGLDFNGNTGGSFTDEVQTRLERKLRALTGGDMAKPIVAIDWNAVTFGGYNLALRLRHAGYTKVYWYRGGREAWEVAGKPEDVVRPTDW